MILTKCHIENFGKFSDFDYEFSNGLNVINQPNGWGKTTLSIFIKAMFFGLKSTRVSSLEENDRKLYQPINNGKFGGYLEFTKDGVNYRLERFFGQNERLDTCKLIDLSTGRVFEEDSRKWGERLFTVNSDAFLRTLFLSQKDLDLSDNQSIADKIGNVYQAVDTDNIDLALKKLDEKAVALKHKRGKGGLIDEKKDRLIILDRAIKECEDAVLGVKLIENSINETEKSLNNLEKEYRSVLDLSKKVREVASIKERRKDYQDKCAERDKTVKLLDEKLKIVKDSNATVSDVYSYTAKVSEIQSLNDEKERLLAEISTKKQIKSETLSAYIAEPTEGDYREFYTLKNEYDSLLIKQDVEEVQVAQPKTKNYTSFILLIISILAIASGIAVAFSSLIIGVIILFAGFIGAIFSLIALINSIMKNNAEKFAYSAKNNFQELQLLESQKTALYSKMILIKGRVGLVDCGDDEFLNKLSFDLEKLSKINTGLEHANDLASNLNIKINDLKIKISEFLSSFTLPKEFIKKSDSEKLSFLTIIMRDITILEAQKSRLDEEIALIINRGIDLPKELESFSTEAIDENERKLSVTLKNKREELQTLKNNRMNCYLMQEKSSEYEQEKTAVEEEIQNLERQFKIVLKTRDLLSESRADLTAKFLRPITDGVMKYLKLFTGDDCKIIVTSDYTVQYELNGEYKSIDYCSRGWKNIYSLALRFAFIDAVYKTDDGKINPFIILDDPFVNYDNEHLRNTLKVLDDIAKSKQILYFVCHDSRF